MSMAIFFPLISAHLAVLCKTVSSELSKRETVGQEQIREKNKNVFPKTRPPWTPLFYETWRNKRRITLRLVAQH